jgi:hypothetical protein
MIHPANLEKAAGEAGFTVGDGVKGVPVNCVEKPR